MKRMMLPVVVGFALGMGGATGIVVAREREARSAAVSRMDDAAENAAGAEPADSAGAGPALPRPFAATDSAALADSLALALAAGAPPSAPPVDTASSAPAPAPSAPSSLAAPMTPAARVPLEGGKISRIFGAMQPREAARVLEQMDDADVQTILASLGDRKAAAILANFVPQRAAALTRGAVHPGALAP